MKSFVSTVLFASLALPTLAAADDFKIRLRGAEEVPPISTKAKGRVILDIDEDKIEFVLSYEGIEGAPTMAHIHFGQRDANGGVSVFFCGGGGKPACLESPGVVEGTITAADVIGPTGQGIAAGELDELIDAIEHGLTYANVHSAKFPSGEIRGQIRD